MTPLTILAICLVAAVVVGSLRSLELAKPLSTSLAPSPEPRATPLRAPARRARPETAAAHPEAA